MEYLIVIFRTPYDRHTEDVWMEGGDQVFVGEWKGGNARGARRQVKRRVKTEWKEGRAGETLVFTPLMEAFK